MVSHFVVPDMTCNHCVMSVKNAIQKIDGIDQIVVDLETKDVTVQHDEKVKPDRVIEAIKSAGYSVEL